MFNSLFTVFDIPLTLILIVLTFFTIFFIKTVYSLFLSLFISVFVIMFTATTMLTQQIFLGEFLIVSTFFIFAILFFVFNSNHNYEDEGLSDNNLSLSKMILLISSFVIMFSIIGLNFYKIDISKNVLINKNPIIQQDLIHSNMNNENHQFYDSYAENIALLNQNKIFQKLTHMIMFYICIVILLYFFNKKGEENER
ncbi:MAG: hypothetical protein PHY80_04280 [Rickettsiales bacterium]|nr:hypothetical protein [Rickettsiales bacterium]